MKSLEILWEILRSPKMDKIGVTTWRQTRSEFFRGAGVMRESERWRSRTVSWTASGQGRRAQAGDGVIGGQVTLDRERWSVWSNSGS